MLCSIVSFGSEILAEQLMGLLVDALSAQMQERCGYVSQSFQETAFLLYDVHILSAVFCWYGVDFVFVADCHKQVMRLAFAGF